MVRCGINAFVFYSQENCRENMISVWGILEARVGSALRIYRDLPTKNVWLSLHTKRIKFIKIII